MPYIVPFLYKLPCRPQEKPLLVYAVNEDMPEESNRAFVQGYWNCTYCGEGNHFRFYDGGSVHEAICPKCKKTFTAVDDME